MEEAQKTYLLDVYCSRAATWSVSQCMDQNDRQSSFDSIHRWHQWTNAVKAKEGSRWANVAFYDKLVFSRNKCVVRINLDETVTVVHTVRSQEIGLRYTVLSALCRQLEQQPQRPSNAQFGEIGISSGRTLLSLQKSCCHLAYIQIKRTNSDVSVDCYWLFDRTGHRWMLTEIQSNCTSGSDAPV